MADPISPAGFLLYLPPAPHDDFKGVGSRFFLIEEARPGELSATRFWDVDLTLKVENEFMCPEYLRNGNLHQDTVELGSSEMSGTKYAILLTGRLDSFWQHSQDAQTFTGRDGEATQSRPGFANGKLVRIYDWELVDDEDVDRVHATILGKVAVAPASPEQVNWDALSERTGGTNLIPTMLQHGLMGKLYGRPTWEEVARKRQGVRAAGSLHGRSDEEEQKMTFLGREQVHEEHLVRENRAHQAAMDQGRQLWRNDPLKLNHILWNLFAAGAYFECDTVEWVVD